MHLCISDLLLPNTNQYWLYSHWHIWKWDIWNVTLLLPVQSYNLPVYWLWLYVMKNGGCMGVVSVWVMCFDIVATLDYYQLHHTTETDLVPDNLVKPVLRSPLLSAHMPLKVSNLWFNLFVLLENWHVLSSHWCSKASESQWLFLL